MRAFFPEGLNILEGSRIVIVGLEIVATLLEGSGRRLHWHWLCASCLSILLDISHKGVSPMSCKVWTGLRKMINDLLHARTSMPPESSVRDLRLENRVTGPGLSPIQQQAVIQRQAADMKVRLPIHKARN